MNMFKARNTLGSMNNVNKDAVDFLNWHLGSRNDNEKAVEWLTSDVFDPDHAYQYIQQINNPKEGE